MFEINLLAAAGEAAGSGAHFNWSYVGKHALNLAILLGALFYLLKEPVSAFIKSRRRGMSEKFEESGRKLNEAKKLFEECLAKLEALNSETESIKSSIISRGERERDAVLRHAHEEKEAILRDVQNSLELSVEASKAEIRKEAIASVIEIAERLLKRRASGAQSVPVKTFETLLKEGKWLRSQN